MLNGLRGKLRVGGVVLLGLLIFGGIHFSEKFQAAARLSQTIRVQDEEITRLKTTIERIQTLRSLQVDLRLKVFGEAAAVPALASRTSSGVLSGELLSIARKTGVEFTSFDPSPAGVTIRFWGRYPDVTRFLELAESTFPRIDHVSIEISKNGGVLLSLTVPGSPS